MNSTSQYPRISLFFLGLIFLGPACSSNHYLLTRQDLACIKQPPVTLELTDQWRSRTVTLNSFDLTLYQSDGTEYYHHLDSSPNPRPSAGSSPDNEFTSFPPRKRLGEPTDNQVKSRNYSQYLYSQSLGGVGRHVIGGEIEEANVSGTWKGALVGGLIVGLISFPLAIAAVSANSGSSDSYQGIGTGHFLYAGLATFFGALWGAILGSATPDYEGRARVLNCEPAAPPAPPANPVPQEFPNSLTATPVINNP